MDPTYKKGIHARREFIEKRCPFSQTKGAYLGCCKRFDKSFLRREKSDSFHRRVRRKRLAVHHTPEWYRLGRSSIIPGINENNLSTENPKNEEHLPFPQRPHNPPLPRGWNHPRGPLKGSGDPYVNDTCS